MRRKEREVNDIHQIIDVLDKGNYLQLAIVDNPYPYIVALNYGYSLEDQLILYMHCALQGKKMDLLSKDNHVAFSIVSQSDFIKSDKDDCHSTTRYCSVVGYGQCTVINDTREKVEALNLIVDHYDYQESHTYSEFMINQVCILKLVVDSYTCKKS